MTMKSLRPDRLDVTTTAAVIHAQQQQAGTGAGTPITRQDILVETRRLLEAFLENELAKRPPTKSSETEIDENTFAAVFGGSAAEYSPLRQSSLAAQKPEVEPESKASSSSSTIIRSLKSHGKSSTTFALVGIPKKSPLTDVEEGFERDQSSTSSENDDDRTSRGSSRKKRRKKSLFQRTRERLQATLNRDREASGSKKKVLSGRYPPPTAHSPSDSSNQLRNRILQNGDIDAIQPKPKPKKRKKRQASKSKSKSIRNHSETEEEEKRNSFVKKLSGSSKKDKRKDKLQKVPKSSGEKFGFWNWVSKQFTCVEHLEAKAQRVNSTAYLDDRNNEEDDGSFGFSSMRGPSDGRCPRPLATAAPVPHPEPMAVEPCVTPSNPSTDASVSLTRRQSVYGQIADRLLDIAEEFMAEKQQFATELNGLAFIDADNNVDRFDDSVNVEEHMNAMLAMQTNTTHGDSQSSAAAKPDVVAELVAQNSLSQSSFRHLMRDYLMRNPAHPQLQLALVLFWTGRALAELTSRGLTVRASSLVNECVAYVGQAFSDWLIGQGGYASAIEGSDVPRDGNHSSGMLRQTESVVVTDDSELD